ncbi:MAG TPA: L,D-transpeptidase family protein [Aliidongia sp.]|uniref:L,D-transpeptidase family protein n=1 Tax=Aliidongia sp. TaxID=1914230 RepID=UPI002DDD5B42|nr:L,D-transpeptidase family protein [Aliidongia sp.]HEV2675325.1 L,D-transpeptidase family protein [Aliidongia sp.]
MDLLVSGDGTARFADRIFRCALGRGGLSDAKREGDGATPIGAWPLRRLLYRPDRILAPPTTGLPVTPIGPADGWCDAPGDKNYNLPVILPYPVSTEALWRDDPVYDLIVPLGYNDGPIVPGHGSAIFLHLARDGYLPTEGCVSLARADMLAYLAVATTASRVIITR